MKRRYKQTRDDFTAKLCTDYNRDCIEDLFGNPVEIINKKKKPPPQKTAQLAFKVPSEEAKQIREVAAMMGMCPSRYCRDAVRKAMKEHRQMFQ